MIDQLFEGCGLVATFVGTLLEGEISMITSVIGARMGYYSFILALVFGFAGSWVSDWFKYFVGRSQGSKLLDKKPALQTKFNKASGWFDKHPLFVLTFYKLFFGMTTVILIMAGLKGISYTRFAFHSAISVAMWVGILGGFGYFYGEQMITNIEFVANYKLQILGSLTTIAFLYWLTIKRPYMQYCLTCAKGE